jgi:hypothetical protein
MITTRETTPYLQINVAICRLRARADSLQETLPQKRPDLGPEERFTETKYWSSPQTFRISRTVKLRFLEVRIDPNLRVVFIRSRKTLIESIQLIAFHNCAIYDYTPTIRRQQINKRVIIAVPPSLSILQINAAAVGEIAVFLGAVDSRRGDTRAHSNRTSWERDSDIFLGVVVLEFENNLAPRDSAFLSILSALVLDR